jgi:hypothetical protein
VSQKYTRERIIKERKCGLKHFDAAVAKIGKKAVIDETLDIFHTLGKSLPGDRWNILGWANANAIMEIIDNHSLVIGANLDEMYDEADMLYLAAVARISLPDTSARKRKKS